MMDEKHADTKPGALAQEHIEALALLLADSDRAESHRDYVELTGPEKAALRAALATIKAQEDVISACNAGLAAVELLIEQSAGVDGLHLDGDMAPWDELRRDGRYCEWLNDYDAAMDAIAAWRAKYGSRP